MRRRPAPFRFEVASSTPWRIVCATYGLPVTGTSTAITRFFGLPLLLEPPQPAASTATPARRITSRRTTCSLQSGSPQVRLLDDAAGSDLGGRSLSDDSPRAGHPHGREHVRT